MRLSLLLCAFAFLAVVLLVAASEESRQEDLDTAAIEANADVEDLAKKKAKKAHKPAKGKKGKSVSHSGTSHNPNAHPKQTSASVCPAKEKNCCGTGNIAFEPLAGHEKDANCNVAAHRYCGENKCCHNIMYGIDSNDPNLVNYAGAVKAANAHFVVRYVSHQLTSQFNTPPVTVSEAKTWHGMGIPLVAVYETSRTRPIDGGTPAKNKAFGKQDAQKAKALMAKIGGKNSPVYFAVDAFVAPKNYKSLRKDIKIPSVNAVIPYFQGIAEVMGLKRTAAYGSYTLIKGLFDKGLITYGWQASSFDSNGRLDPRAQLYQCNVWIPNSFGSSQVDYDLALHKDFGQWK